MRVTFNMATTEALRTTASGSGGEGRISLSQAFQCTILSVASHVTQETRCFVVGVFGVVVPPAKNHHRCFSEVAQPKNRFFFV